MSFFWNDNSADGDSFSPDEHSGAETGGTSRCDADILHQEIQGLARLTATTTCGLNLWLAGEKQMAEGVGAFMPPQPVMHQVLIGSGNTNALEPETIGLIQHLSTGLHLAKALLTRELDGHTIKQDAGRDSIVYLADLWRNMCDLTIEILFELHAIIICNRGTASKIDDGEIMMLLAAARDGGYPALDQGTLTAPGWAERRQASRRDASWSAELLHGSQRYFVLINDVSPNGIGLSGISANLIGQYVTIVLDNQRRLEGTIVWFGKDRAGLELDRQLAPNDPLLGAVTSH